MSTEVHELADLGTGAHRAPFERDVGVGKVRPNVRDIIERIRREGNVAVRELSSEFDGVQVGNIDVTDTAECAYDEVDDDVRKVIETAIVNAREFHEKQIPEDWHEEFDDVGTHKLGRRYRLLDQVGVRAPDGTAVYPSSILVGVISTRVVGVKHVAVATPPVEPMNPVTFATMHVTDADVVYLVGDMQDTAALAYGTETVRAVQKVTGLDNRQVIVARAEVHGDVDIDFLVGPSEVLVVANEMAEARFVAADLVVQAEYDPNTLVAVVTDDTDLAAKVVAGVERQADERERAETIETVLGDDVPGAFLTRSVSGAVLFAGEYAAEHLMIQADDDEALSDRIDSAGGVFLSPYTLVAAGDYASGTNHVLLTGGDAKRQGGPSVDRFVRLTTVQCLNRDGLPELSETITTLVEAEDLDTHAQGVYERFEE